jgi:heme exporter protein CcmD
MPAFFAMGKYAAFVWPSYGISALGIVAAVVLSLHAYRRAKTRLAALERNTK